MNKVILTGNLTKEVELRYTPKNLAVAHFTLAVKRDSNNTDFLNCVAYGNQAETITKYLDKGNRVGIDGHIQTGSYENKDGKKVYTTDIVVEKVEFLNNKKEEQDGFNE